MTASPNQPGIIVPTLKTQRLVLAPLSQNHSKGMFQLWSNPLVCRYSGEVRDAQGERLPMPAPDADTSDKIIQFWQQAVVDGWGFRWAMESAFDGAFLGTVGFNSLGPCTEVAYHQLPDFWGQGYMTEALSEALLWVQQCYSVMTLEAYIEPQNQHSIALVKRLGFYASDQFSEGAQRYVRAGNAT